MCGIIDTKSTNSYDLPHQDVTKAITTYIDTASELYGARGNLELKFVSYISHLIGGGATARAKDIYDAKGIPVALISAYGLNAMRDEYAYKGMATSITDMLSNKPVSLFV